ncbi:hypothetical protein EVAR_51710_1 [Eumeta japonica]|uniref:Uncharacterized protein n=1 Tax=Eumeta variegata TaxID=151549 RepID=A0A4C1XH85_EUMVA|nr:hypothetical protein EVAR_51710_1 [Eumeta japonica]
MLRASQISKSVEIEGVSPLEQTPKNLTPINLDATPARSILKSKNTDMSARKLTKTVLFDNCGLDSDKKNSPNITDEEKLDTIDFKPHSQTNETIKLSHNKMSLKENTECTNFDSNMVKDTGKHKQTVAKRSKKKTPLRQQACNGESVNLSTIMTRQRRLTAMATADSENASPKPETKKKASRTSEKKKAFQEIEINIHQSKNMEKGDDTLIQGKSGRKQQKLSELCYENMVKSTPRKSNRKSKASTATGLTFHESENIPCNTPRRSLRKSD